MYYATRTSDVKSAYWKMDKKNKPMDTNRLTSRLKPRRVWNKIKRTLAA